MSFEASSPMSKGSQNGNAVAIEVSDQQRAAAAAKGNAEKIKIISVTATVAVGRLRPFEFRQSIATLLFPPVKPFAVIREGGGEVAGGQNREACFYPIK